MNKNMLSLAILAATRMAPRFANEDGELMFDFLVGEFPALTEDQLDLIVTRACLNAKAGFKAVGGDAFAADLLADMS